MVGTVDLRLRRQLPPAWEALVHLGSRLLERSVLERAADTAKRARPFTRDKPKTRPEHQARGAGRVGEKLSPAEIAGQDRPPVIELGNGEAREQVNASQVIVPKGCELGRLHGQGR